jgi:hypothetical protein
VGRAPAGGRAGCAQARDDACRLARQLREPAGDEARRPLDIGRGDALARPADERDEGDVAAAAEVDDADRVRAALADDGAVDVADFPRSVSTPLRKKPSRLVPPSAPAKVSATRVDAASARAAAG